MSTLNFVLRKDKEKKSGVVPVYLRITVERTSRFLATDVSIDKDYWDSKKQRVKSSHPLSEKYNELLLNLLTKSYDELQKLKMNQRLSAKTLQLKLKAKDPTNVFQYCRNYIKLLKQKDQYWEVKKYRVLLNKLKAFRGSEDLTFYDIDVKFLNDFEVFMISKYKNKINTRAKMFDKLKRLFKMAAEESLIPYQKNPFLRFAYKREKTHKAKLTEGQLGEIEQLDLSMDSWIWHTRNFFMFSFYCAGIRFGDICQLKWKNITEGKYLSYVMDKTGVKKTIILSNQAKRILDFYRAADANLSDFIFPLLDNEADYSEVEFLKRRISARNALVNKYLKKIAKRISFNESLSFHVARHSFADYARTKGVDIYSISKALGHSSLSITEGYLKSLDQQSVDEAIKDLFSS